MRMTFGSRLLPILRAQRKGDKVVHNLTPLGTMMHLKELDRQVAPKLLQMRSRRQDIPSVTAVGAAVIALWRRLYAVGIPGR
jgi:hypothetical protein